LKINAERTADGGRGNSVFYHPLNPGVNFEEKVPILYLEGDGSTLTKEDIKETLKELVKKGTMITRDTAGFIEIGSGRSIRHISGSSQSTKRIRDIGARIAKMLALNNINELVENSVLVESGKNKDASKTQIKAYHRFYTPIRTKGGLYVIRIVAEERIDKNDLIPIEADLYELSLNIKIPQAPPSKPQAA
jgi:hypothetical protein